MLRFRSGHHPIIFDFAQDANLISSALVLAQRFFACFNKQPFSFFYAAMVGAPCGETVSTSVKLIGNLRDIKTIHASK
jgi:hypothetical protein